jgi:hypothetical protein
MLLTVKSPISEASIPIAGSIVNICRGKLLSALSEESFCADAEIVRRKKEKETDMYNRFFILSELPDPELELLISVFKVEF